MAEGVRFGRNCSAAFGGLMIGLGMALGVLGTLMANPSREQIGYASATILTALGLLIALFVLGISESRTRSRQSASGYLLAGGVSIVCCLIYWRVQSALVDLRLLAVMAALHGLFWGAWYLRLAFQFRANFKRALVLCTVGAATSSFGIVLGTISGLTRFSCVSVVGCFMIGLGIEIFVTAAFLHREYARESMSSDLELG
jgi:hypothetical protein